MNKKKHYLLFLLALLYLNPENVLAVNGDGFKSEESTAIIKDVGDEDGSVAVIADINIRNAMISETAKNHLKLVFEVENLMELQSNLIYGLELVKNRGEDEIIADIKLFPDDKIIIGKNIIVKKEIEYVAPRFLNGDYTLWLKIKDESGLTLALESFQVNLAGTGELIEESGDCYLTIDGEKNQQYSLIQGIDVKKDEKLFLECKMKNFLGESVTVIPLFDFYRRDFYGEKVKTVNMDQSATIVFAKDEDKLVKIAIPLPENPQAYDVKVTLSEKEIILSNPIIVHFVLAGKSGTIINASLDKNVYQKGEKAKLSLFWSGSADTFLENRTGGSYLANSSFEVEFKTTDGISCAKKASYKTGSASTILAVPIENDCSYPVVTIKLVDDGQVLYEKVIHTGTVEELKTQRKKPVAESMAQPEEEKDSNLPVAAVISITLLVVILIIGFYWKNKESGNFPKIGLFIVILLTSFLVAENSQAYTATYNGSTSWNPIYSKFTAEWVARYVDSDSNWYGPLEPCSGFAIPVVGGVVSGLPLCPPVTDFRPTVACKFRDNVPAIWVNGTYYGCASTVVTFTYNLNRSRVNQGGNIKASGSVIGTSVCSNGMISKMSVSPQNNDDRNAIFELVSVYGKGRSRSGSYTFNTAGFPCGRNIAQFYFDYRHGTLTTFTDHPWYGGRRSIGYIVNNCGAVSTCSAEAGCRATLDNGVVDSLAGTCAPGLSCFKCADGYRWTGSMCTQNICTGGQAGGLPPLNTTAWSSDESTGLSADTPWSYSVSDTPSKCQFRCDSDYVWKSATATCELDCPSTSICNPANCTDKCGWQDKTCQPSPVGCPNDCASDPCAGEKTYCGSCSSGSWQETSE